MASKSWSSCASNAFLTKRKLYGVAIAVLCVVLLSSPTAQAASDSHQFGIGIGEVLPESVVTIKTLVDFSATAWLTARANLELASIFGTVVLPIEAEAIVPIKLDNQTFTPYVGLGGALVFTASDFGLRSAFGVNGLIGARITAQVPLFLQVKFRIYGSRTTYQFDAGVMF